MKPHIFELLPRELENYFLSKKEKKYRAKQTCDWIYKKQEIDFHKMSTISADLKDRLINDFDCYLPKIIKKNIAQDGTSKYLLELRDSNKIEMVLIPFKEKNTLCVSTQVGCKWDCSFCATGKMGFIRNLEVHEIISQIFLAKKELADKKLTNIVFMGMGEPLDNFENLIKSIKILQLDDCFQFSPRRMTVSTCGLIPEIRKLADIGLKVKLAISLNSAIQSKREELMPVSKVYPLTELKEALLDFRKKSNYRITFEYIMIKDFNMGKEDIKALIKFLGDISCKLNLIAWNEVEDLPFQTPSQIEIDRFSQSLSVLQSAVTFRKSRGLEIGAACGQLVTQTSGL
ncbi:MAG TPA: 23S rRNA (adenine(2503)-C(2))-methyltransferase RlmN [Candidatus Cloacimonetes bacterium]|nr:23S rRNA (adenine(2503)-C(2))-methyltransferase RlmN [Candidatus Cloacimonadota bacterium]